MRHMFMATRIDTEKSNSSKKFMSKSFQDKCIPGEEYGVYSQADQQRPMPAESQLRSRLRLPQRLFFGDGSTPLSESTFPNDCSFPFLSIHIDSSALLSCAHSISLVDPCNISGALELSCSFNPASNRVPPSAMNHPSSAPPEADEKGSTAAALSSPAAALPSATTSPSPASSPAHRSLAARLLSPGYLVEARGISRVLPADTQPLTWQSYAQAFVLWFSINLAAVNVTLGMLAPVVFGLGFTDAALCAVLGSALGSCAVAYTATWGAKGGVRTMVCRWRLLLGWTSRMRGQS